MRWPARSLALVMALTGCRQLLGIEDLASGDGGRADAGDDAGAADASSCAGAQPQTACGGLALLRDDFEDGEIGTQWVSYAPATGEAVEDGGELSLSPGTVPPGSAYWASRHNYDFTGAIVTVEVPDVVDGGDAVTELGIDLPDMDRVYARHGQGMLTFGSFVGGVPTESSIEYDPDQHRFWRVIHAPPSNVGLSVSADGCDFESVAVAPLSVSEAQLPYATLRLEARHDITPGAGTARFDDLDVVAPQVPWCASTTFQDDFNVYTTISLLPAWRALPSTCNARTVTGGQVRLTAVGNQVCGFETARRFQLEEASIGVQVMSISGTGQAELIALGDDRTVLLVVRSTGYHLMTCDTSSCLDAGSVNLSPGLAVLSLEVSGGNQLAAWVFVNASWEMVGVTTAPSNPMAFSFKVVSGNSGQADVVFDDFNVMRHP